MIIQSFTTRQNCTSNYTVSPCRVFITVLLLLQLQCFAGLSVCTECIVAKRCVLEQTLLLTAYRKSYMRNRLVPNYCVTFNV